MRPVGERLVAARRRDLHRERALAHQFAHRRQLLFRDREAHVDRLHLVDHHQRNRVVRLHHVARLQQRAADIAVDRRADHRVLEIQLRVLERRLARLRGRLGGLRVGAVLRVGVLGDEILVQQFLVAPSPATRAWSRLATSRSACASACLQRRLERARVDPEQHLALLHFLAFAELHLQDLAVDARLHRHRGVGLDVADGLQAHRDGLLHCGHHRDRDRGRALGGGFFPRARVAAEIGDQAARGENRRPGRQGLRNVFRDS